MSVTRQIIEPSEVTTPGAGEQLDMICNWLRRNQVGHHSLPFREISKGIFTWNEVLHIQVKYLTLEDVYIFVKDEEFGEEYSYRGPNPLLWFKKTMDEVCISTTDLKL